MADEIKASDTPPLSAPTIDPNLIRVASMRLRRDDTTLDQAVAARSWFADNGDDIATIVSAAVLLVPQLRRLSERWKGQAVLSMEEHNIRFLCAEELEALLASLAVPTEKGK